MSDKLTTNISAGTTSSLSSAYCRRNLCKIWFVSLLASLDRLTTWMVGIGPIWCAESACTVLRLSIGSLGVEIPERYLRIARSVSFNELFILDSRSGRSPFLPNEGQGYVSSKRYTFGIPPIEDRRESRVWPMQTMGLSLASNKCNYTNTFQTEVAGWMIACTRRRPYPTTSAPLLLVE